MKTTMPVAARDWARSHERYGVELLEAQFERHVYERHMHDTYAIGVTLRGVQRFWCCGATRNSMPGDVIMIPPGTVHDGQSGSAGGYRYLMFYVPLSLVRDVIEDALERPAAPGVYASPLFEDPALARSLTSAWSAMSASSTLAADVVFRDSLLTLARRHGGLLQLPSTTIDAPALTNVRDYLHAHPGRVITVAELASLASMSRFQLTRQFQRAFGLPLHAYHLHVRLEESRRRLTRGTPIAVVAAELGFSDQSHLHRRFKGAFGVTPAQWQAVHNDPRR
jgi:AraC-like DNA-binding protein